MARTQYLIAVHLTCLGLLASCAGAEDDEDAAEGTVHVVDSRSLALTGSDVQSINGTYSTCQNRTGNWSLAVTGTPTLDYTTLSVVRANTACALALTEVRTGTNGKLVAPTPIALGTSFGTAQAFGTPIAYYANANISSVTFLANFTVTLLISDDPRVGTATVASNYAVVTATATTMGVTAPNYTLDVSGVAVTGDFSNVVQTVTGNFALTAGSSTGDFYVISAGAVADTYSAINTAYLAGTPVTMATSIAASTVMAVGTDLTGGVVRSLIIAKIQSGVRSYQKFAITFSAPT